MLTDNVAWYELLVVFLAVTGTTVNLLLFLYRLGDVAVAWPGRGIKLLVSLAGAMTHLAYTCLQAAFLAFGMLALSRPQSPNAAEWVYLLFSGLEVMMVLAAVFDLYAKNKLMPNLDRLERLSHLSHTHRRGQRHGTK